MYLSFVIFYLYQKSDFEYASDNEKLMSDTISVWFTSIQESSHVIGIKEKYLILILKFEDGSAKEEF